MKIHLTKKTVDALDRPKTGYLVIWDRELTGFGMRISATGRKTFFVQKRTTAGREINKTIGVLGGITVEQARRAAGELLARLAAGADPAAEQRQTRAAEVARRNTLTVGELGDKYLVKYAQRKKRPASVVEDRSMIERIIKRTLIGDAQRPLGDLLVPDVKHGDIADLHEALEATPYMANRVVALLSKMFTLAVKKWEMRPDNPVSGI